MTTLETILKQACREGREWAGKRTLPIPMMEHNGPANIIRLCRDVKDGIRPLDAQLLALIEANAQRTIAYMDAWDETPGIPWHNVRVK